MLLAKPAFLRLDHPTIHRVDPAIFRVGFAPDCMTHACKVVDEGHRRLDDACCRFGCDVDLFEQRAILARVAEIARVMPPERRDPAGWFDDDEPADVHDTPSGQLVRTHVKDRTREDGGCVFLQPDRRGCSLHRAAVEADFDPAEIKPLVCRLFPLNVDAGVLALSEDFDHYSCAGQRGHTVYQVMRDTLRQVYGAHAVALLDALRDRATVMPVVQHA